MTEIADRDVWRQARDLLNRWEALTGEIETLIAGDEAVRIAPLLSGRQQLSDQLDALKERHGIASWMDGPADENRTAEMTALQEEVAAILKRLAAGDERIRQAMRARLGALAQEIDQVRQTGAANRTYRRRNHSATGAFIDTRR